MIAGSMSMLMRLLLMVRMLVFVGRQVDLRVFMFMSLVPCTVAVFVVMFMPVGMLVLMAVLTLVRYCFVLMFMLMFVLMLVLMLMLVRMLTLYGFPPSRTIIYE